MPERYGITPPIEVMGFGPSVDLCVRAEALGYTDVWSQESNGTDGFSPLAAVAVRTSTVRLGIAVVPVYTRPPALMAMSAAGLQQVAGGRFVLGLGASSPAIVAGWMGQDYSQPVARVREYVQVLRPMLAGEKVTHHGPGYQVKGFRLGVDAGSPIPIYLAALGPRMCRLAGAVADGVAFFLMTPEGVTKALQDVRAGAEEAGRDPAALDSVIRLPIAVEEPEDLVRFMGRRMMTGYAIVPGYNASLARQGFEAEAEEIVGAWGAGERDRATEAFTDEMLERMFIFGDAETCRRKIGEFRSAGVKTPILYPFSLAGSAEERAERVTAAVEALAPTAS
ncbi:MAG TPA: LLM class F420-dependent oxidoreductase [Actinomycetota bacterium]|nr:LLM class F420-dependent oxidoreductase [Actinomycetota bacterium]